MATGQFALQAIFGLDRCCGRGLVSNRTVTHPNGTGTVYLTQSLPGEGVDQMAKPGLFGIGVPEAPGGPGIVRGPEVERQDRDAKSTQFPARTTQIQRMILARERMKKGVRG